MTDIDPWGEQFYVRCFLPMLRRESHPRVLWPCLTWSGLRSQGGYGIIVLPDRLIPTHTYSLRMVGVEPGDSQVRHMCDRRTCCNPLHMLLGDAKDNWRDRDEHGARSASLASAWAPFAPDFLLNRFQRSPNPWTRPLPA